VATGRLRRLGVETCPGTGKSLFWAVIFPAWLLLREYGRARVMAGSYSHDFAERDGTRCRDLVQSEWYRGLVAATGDWHIREDVNKKGDWWTTATGRRLITSISGATVGHRCTWQIIDDPLSEADVFSSTNKAEAVRWSFEVMPSRLEDQRTDPRVMVMQRLDVADPLGEARKRGWPILSLPAVLGMWGVPEEGCVLVDDAGVEVWRDPRKPGEPIVELLDLPTLERMRVELGASVFAAKYLQRPGDDSSAMFKRTWWRWHGPAGVARPAGAGVAATVRTPDMFDRLVITADLTFGSLVGDYAAVQAWGAVGPDRYLLAQIRGRAGFEQSKQWILRLARRFPGAKVCVEKAANGHAVIEELRKVAPAIKALKPWGKKAQRHAAASPSVEAGNVYLPVGAVLVDVDQAGERLVDATDFLEEHAGATKHDDQMDATSYAIIELNASSGDVGEPASGDARSISAPSASGSMSEAERAAWAALL
jgi:predicted phage terminase large subunit-like protein